MKISLKYKLLLQINLLGAEKSLFLSLFCVVNLSSTLYVTQHLLHAAHVASLVRQSIIAIVGRIHRD